MTEIFYNVLAMTMESTHDDHIQIPMPDDDIFHATSSDTPDVDGLLNNIARAEFAQCARI